MNEYADGILDISPDVIMENTGKPEMAVILEMTDNALESLAKETGLLEQTGCFSLEETSGTEYEFEVSAAISENLEVSAEITLKSDTDRISVPIEVNQEFADAVIDAAEKHLEACNSSIQQEFAEYQKDQQERE